MTVTAGLLTGDRVLSLIKPKVCPSVIQYKNLGKGNHFGFVLTKRACFVSSLKAAEDALTNFKAFQREKLSLFFWTMSLSFLKNFYANPVDK